tara:strand:- start:644 stop:880 length:237 start_codon:yes stop_codon:yes gene_type:complete
MLEGEYLEMVNNLKEKFDEKDKEVEKIKDLYKDVVKDFLSVYGYVRLIDMCDDMEREGLIEILRGFLSERFEEIVFPT